jgi:hypothetical protein
VLTRNAQKYAESAEIIEELHAGGAQRHTH